MTLTFRVKDPDAYDWWTEQPRYPSIVIIEPADLDTSFPIERDGPLADSMRESFLIGLTRIESWPSWNHRALGDHNPFLCDYELAVWERRYPTR